MNENLSMKSKKQIIIHPFLFAIFPILSLFANNILSVSFDDIIFPLSIAILITFLIWIALGKVLKNKIKSGFITSLGLIMFFSYGHIYILLDGIQNDNDLSHFFILIPSFILFGISTYYFIKTKRRLDNATFIVNIVAISLVIISFVSIVDFIIIQNDSLNNISEELIENPIRVGNVENLPDIYYIIPDGYGGSKALQLLLNFDNSEFIDFLTKKGFYVSSESYSNYRETSYSIPSTLNMDYLHYLIEGKGEGLEGRKKLKEMTANAEVFQFLKSQGYTIFFIEGLVVNSKNSEIVDFRLCSSGKYLKEFDIQLIRTTILQPIYVELLSGNIRDHKLCPFSELIKISELDNKPKFVLAHIMIPHAPYIFGPNGEALLPKDLSLDPKLSRERYLDQLKFTNKKIQEVVEKLTATDTSPIIIIESDHGPKSGHWEGEYERNLVHFNNFKAYYFPDKGRNVEFETTTSVNSFRVLFNLYFDEDYELLEDKIYFNPKDQLDKFIDRTHFSIKSPHAEAVMQLSVPLVQKFLEIIYDPLTTGTTFYTVVVTGTILPGPNANLADVISPDGTTINGRIHPTGLDDFSFTGDIVSITAGQHIFSFVDGVEVPNGSPTP